MASKWPCEHVNRVEGPCNNTNGVEGPCEHLNGVEGAVRAREWRVAVRSPEVSKEPCE
jgi:hypothetical protein